MAKSWPLFLIGTSAIALHCTGGADTASERAARGVEPALVLREVPALSAASPDELRVLWDRTHDRPRQISGRFPIADRNPVSAARTFLAEHRELFRLDPSPELLTLASERRGLAGTYVRFRQQYQGLPVFGAEVVVLVTPDQAGSEVRAASLAHASLDARSAHTAAISDATATAIAAAAADFDLVTDALSLERGSIVAAANELRLVARVRLQSSEPYRSVQVDVDAESGQVLEVRDLLQRVTGSGMVFDPNPVASSGNTALTDNNDATSVTLDAARVSVSLPNLDGSNLLRGFFVDVCPDNVNNRAQDATNTFNFDRADDRFEEVMAYFHIDRVQTRIQTLGFTDANNRQTIVIVDFDNNDNSFYSPGDKQLRYGAGGVDDAEDADILVHEYAHAVLDNVVPGFPANNVASAFAEGFGDYFAASFEAVLSPQVADPACIADWDATSYSVDAPPCMRRVDGTKHYPEHADGEVHDDGEIWSAALYGSEQLPGIGADLMNTLAIESLFLLTSSPSTEEIVAAFLSADQTLFFGSHAQALRRRFIEQGLSRLLSTAANVPDVIDSNTISVDNPREPTDYANNLDDTQTVTFPSATAVRLHFTQIATETDVSCLDSICDNLYLYNAAGDLFQILGGTQTDVTSVQIPGDTVKIRLVTDFSTGAFGYHVDRVDSMGTLAGSGGSSGAGGTPDSGGEAGNTAEGGTNTGGTPSTGGEGGSPSGGVAGSGGEGVAGEPGAGGEPTGVSGSSGEGGSGAANGAAGTSTSAGRGGTTASGGAAAGGGAAGTADSADDGGCGCEVPGGERRGAEHGYSALVLGLIWLRRRRSLELR